MGRISDIDETEFRRMYAANVPTPEMAQHFSIGREGISKAARQFGLTVRQKGGVGLAKKPPSPALRKPTSDTIAATQGRYALLCEYATRNGLTYRQALTLWHRERVKV